jgi:hypothetical protein
MPAQGRKQMDSDETVAPEGEVVPAPLDELEARTGAGDDELEADVVEMAEEDEDEDEDEGDEDEDADADAEDDDDEEDDAKEDAEGNR